ncbi:unnamed protein product, partial [Ectocarpus sp. 12 AP-2014]
MRGVGGSRCVHRQSCWFNFILTERTTDLTFLESALNQTIFEMSHEDFLSGIIGEGPLITWWDERQLINRLDHYNDAEDCICLEEQEIIWAAIVHYEACFVADWMVFRGYNATPEWHDDCDNVFLCVPHDASKWDQWLQSSLMMPPLDVPERRIKNSVCSMVENGYIKIPLNSGYPLYHWLLEG